MSQQEIQVGDRVRCIDASASFHRLTEGGIYTVEAAYNGDPIVIVDRAYHSLERFELVTEAAPPGGKDRIATGTESARQTARTGSASTGSAHPVQEALL